MKNKKNTTEKILKKCRTKLLSDYYLWYNYDEETKNYTWFVYDAIEVETSSTCKYHLQTMLNSEDNTIKELEEFTKLYSSYDTIKLFSYFVRLINLINFTLCILDILFFKNFFKNNKVFNFSILLTYIYIYIIPAQLFMIHIQSHNFEKEQARKSKRFLRRTERIESNIKKDE